MNVYISGGAKCGKSEIGENLAVKMAKEENLPIYYVATMIPKDREDEKRVENHRKSRAHKGFETLELKRPEDFEIISNQNSGAIEGVFLFDSVTAFLENVIFDEEYNVDPDAWKKVTATLLAFLQEKKNVIFISDFIFSDGVNYPETTEIFRKNLANCDRILAKACDHLWEVSAGQIIEYK